MTTDLDLMRPMTDTQRLLFQTEMLKRRKRVGVAAALCVLGPIGTHRFYLGQIGRGLVLLALTLTGVGLIITVPWALVDLFGIRRLVESVNGAIAREAAAQIMALPSGQAMPSPARAAITPERTKPGTASRIGGMLVMAALLAAILWIAGMLAR